MANKINWTCPFCHHPQIVTDSNLSGGFDGLYVGDNKYGNIGFSYLGVACLNQECREVFFQVDLRKRKSDDNGDPVRGDVIEIYNLRPESNAKIFPEFIPNALRQNYIEACRIKSLSPKASATMARRCLQGIIRDFCQISKATLDAEIKKLSELLASGAAPVGVTPESVEAIDHVRNIGNIGAHMEKDINIIVDIDEGEAQCLIDLIELLFEEWYIARESRNRRLERVKQIRIDKDSVRNGILQKS